MGTTILLSPAFYAFVPVLAVAYAAVVFGRCRNEYLAVGLAVVVASIAYWGQFPAALADELGPRALLSPRLVAKYVALRMNHESMESYPAPPPEGVVRKRRPRVEPGVNWTFGFAEWAGLMVASIGLLLYRSRMAYCERCGWWTSRERLVLLPKSGSKIREQFETGTLDQLKLFMTCEVRTKPARGESGEPRFLSADEATGRPLSRPFRRVHGTESPSESGATPRGQKPPPTKPTIYKPAWWLLRCRSTTNRSTPSRASFQVGRRLGQRRVSPVADVEPQNRRGQRGCDRRGSAGSGPPVFPPVAARRLTLVRLGRPSGGGFQSASPYRCL